MFVIIPFIIAVAMINPVVQCKPTTLVEYNQCFVDQIENATPVAEYKFND